jgi:hypothetical protein
MFFNYSFKSNADPQLLPQELLFMIVLEHVRFVQVILTLPLDITRLPWMEHTNSHSMQEL